MSQSCANEGRNLMLESTTYPDGWREMHLEFGFNIIVLRWYCSCGAQNYSRNWSGTHCLQIRTFHSYSVQHTSTSRHNAIISLYICNISGWHWLPMDNITRWVKGDASGIWIQDYNIKIILFMWCNKITVETEVVDTLPSDQCVSLLLELISTTYQHK